MVSLGGPAGARHPIAFLATADFNLQGQQHARQFAAGEGIAATVAALPSPATGGRLLLAAPLAAQPARGAGARAGAAGAGAKAGEQQGQRPEAPAAGTLVAATVGAVHALYAELALEGGCHGRLHITEAAPAGDDSSPLAALSAGDKLQVVVLGRVASEQGRRHGLLECSTLPEAVAAAQQAAGGAAPAAAPQPLAWGRLKPGQQLRG